MVDQIRELRRDTFAALMAMADGNGETEERTRQIDETLKRMQYSLSQNNPAPDLQRNRNTLTFGLHEVRQALAYAYLIEMATSR
ncbi:hypothetical protein ACOI1H_23135 [Loktanella sp. DJP18]|uniref:hypothetical protein n=1 Tax=Loktanella sp. DJP18 TaxID=3409788 RepID=UPI003BB4F53A